MLTAFLYIRVSTDEQAKRGYSLPAQEEKLRQYCVVYRIQILKIIEEDYSAITFDRPGWRELIIELNRCKGRRPDLLLFTRWDRFSRNAADAYYAIRQLNNLGIEPQATDQPLDLSVPENKLMLAMYIAVAEVENDRRALNVKQSIREARQQGRWTSHTPLGYSSQLLSNGHRGIVPKEPEASLIKESFRLVTMETWRSIQSIFEQMVANGLKCSRSHFWRILGNKVYYGMVKVPAQEECEAYWLKGQHDAIISESLFMQAQQILDRRKRTTIIIGNPNEKLLLRGYLYCPKCAKRLTGSRSKGRKSYYYYYHCTPPCDFRFRADMVNELFYKELDKLLINPRYLELYREVLKQTRKELFAEQNIKQKTLLSVIDGSINRILNAKELAEKGNLTIDEFAVIKEDGKKKIGAIGLQLQQSVFFTKRNKKNLENASFWLSGLSDFFSSSNLVTKMELLTLFFHNNKIVLANDFRFADSFCYSMQSIFDLKIAGHTRGIYPYRTSVADGRLKMFLRKVMEIECQKGNDVSKIMAQEIIGFLMHMASIVTRRVS